MSHAPDWNRIDTVLCDMDGTLLDLHYDNFFWMEEVPRTWGAERGLDLEAARAALFPVFDRNRGSLNWYCLDFWTRTLAMDLRSMKRQHAERIAYLPGIEAVLLRLRAQGKALVLVTNAHPDTLALKHEHTGLLGHFDAAHSTHSFGAPKEQPQFWARFATETGIDLDRSLLVDDTLSVLEGAAAGGVGHLLAVLQPSTKHPAREPGSAFPEVHTLADLVLP
ncbi:MAG: GMP/IMP nucleotidase [Oceanococcaceae bacterium]